MPSLPGYFEPDIFSKLSLSSPTDSTQADTTIDQDQPEHVTGLIERVTFHSSESGFAVLRVKVRGRHELVTVVGTIPNVNAGEWIDARGRWVIDS
ncbi:MAG: hypothetical protein JXQ83_09045, partial [Candidatus Glassbacteria bacterium]|nr:hypothetical protein [Candidatus Glassbacteria bacterium]